MGSVRNLLVRGNGKLGENIHAWSLPAGGKYCPGSSDLCESVCYARSGRFLLPFVRERLEENYRISRRPGFADRMIREVKRRWVQVCRVHVSGDFYDAAYAEAWLKVFRACPRAKFFAYTRSYRVADVEPVLREMSLLRNVRLWYSCDAQTGIPGRVPVNVRVAWMMEDENERFEIADLVFVVRRLRKGAPKRVGLALVCPNERPVDKAKGLNCTTCGKCWK